MDSGPAVGPRLTDGLKNLTPRPPSRSGKGEKGGFTFPGTVKRSFSPPRFGEGPGEGLTTDGHQIPEPGGAQRRVVEKPACAVQPSASAVRAARVVFHRRLRPH